MSLQPSLFDPIRPIVQPRRAVPGQDLEAQFQEFHQANPHVYEALRRMALDLRRRGSRKIGMKMLFEVLRWQYYMTTDDPAGDDFKLNNNYTAYYARELMANEPALADAFETRERRSPMPKKTKLQLIAESMLAILEQPGNHWRHKKLPRGLEILFERKDSTLRLELAREDVSPSQHEIRLCREAFGVPASVEVDMVQRLAYHVKTNRRIIYHVAEMSWIEEPEIAP